MGMDLIGYIFVGPPEIKFGRREQARVDWPELARGFAGRLAQEEVSTPLADSGLAEEDGVLEVLRYLCLPSATCGDALGVLVHPARVRKAVVEIVSTFLRTWRGQDSPRRWMDRLAKVGKTEVRIGVCTDMSWGDAPEDEIWQTCAAVSYLLGASPTLRAVTGLR